MWDDRSGPFRVQRVPLPNKMETMERWLLASLLSMDHILQSISSHQLEGAKNFQRDSGRSRFDAGEGPRQNHPGDDPEGGAIARRRVGRAGLLCQQRKCQGELRPGVGHAVFDGTAAFRAHDQGVRSVPVVQPAQARGVAAGQSVRGRNRLHDGQHLPRRPFFAFAFAGERHVGWHREHTQRGTGHILNAVRAHLEVYGKRRGISHPEIVCGSTAHCSLNKACEILNIRLVCIDCNDGCSYELKADRVRKHITCNTIMIFASAPSFPQGTIDPIEELSEVAMRCDVGLHVDACLGGFVLPFCSEDMVSPKIVDFRLKGVTSMSADTHKFGHATKGTSVVLFRTMDLQHASYFPCSDWSGGLYITPTIAGSRPGALIACAWSAMVSIGESGYRRRAKSIVNAARRIAREITSIEGIQLMTPDPTIVVCFGSDEFNIYNVKDSLSKMGWSLNPLQSPPSINVCVTENLVNVLDDFMRDLRSAVDEVKDQVSTQKKTKGTEALYEIVKMLPSGPVEHAMCKFIDAALAP